MEVDNVLDVLLIRAVGLGGRRDRRSPTSEEVTLRGVAVLARLRLRRPPGHGGLDLAARALNELPCGAPSE